MKEKIIEILKKHHLHHYGDFEKAVEELNNLFEKVKHEVEILPITYVAVNQWEGIKYKPSTMKLIDKEKVLNILQNESLSHDRKECT